MKLPLSKQEDSLYYESEEYHQLLERAAANRGTPHNIEEWAKQLAGDIADLTD